MNKRSAAILVIIGWLVTAAVGVYEIILLRGLFFRLYASFRATGVSDYEAFLQANAANTFGILITLSLTIIWIVTFIGSAEYYRRRIGQPSSWTLLTRISAVELAIVLLVWFI